MTAERLRRAAALMRSRAKAATEGEWFSDSHFGGDGMVVMAPRGRIAHMPEPDAEWQPIEANAEHIASWHPAVALAVADWLERVADDEPSWSYAHAGVEAEYALAVANAYLGGDQ